MKAISSKDEAPYLYYELLGFDIRSCPGDYLQIHWVRDRNTEFLLRPEIFWPLSVDEEVWPSVFGDFWPWVSIEESTIVDHPGDPELPTSHREKVLYLWMNLTGMKDFFRRRVPGRHGISVALVLVSECSVRHDEYWDFVLYPYDKPSPVDVPQDWVLLGYDVADRDLTSGLMNHRYADDQRASLAAAWAPHLNGHGLFDSPAEALRFRAMTDQRVPGDAPFYVYGLYREPSGCDESHIDVKEK